MTLDDTLSFVPHLRRASDRRAVHRPPHADACASALPPGVLMRVLDEIGWGVLVLDGGHQLRYANPVARSALGQTIALVSGRIVACHGDDREPLRRALARAGSGLRTMLSLAHGETATMVAIVPLRHADAVDEDDEILVLLSRPATADPLAIQLFAGNHALTDSESRVLALLCNGSCPNDIASELGVAITTIRTQLGAIRSKTRTANLRDLVQRIATLPPMTSLPRLRA